MPSGPLNIKKMIHKKRPKTLPVFKPSTFVLSPDKVEDRKQENIEKKEKLDQKRVDDIKRFKRSINRIWMARYIETNYGTPFMEVCDLMESKNSKILNLVKKIKQELAYKKFGPDEEEGEEDMEVEEQEGGGGGVR